MDIKILILALMMVESGGDDLAVGDDGRAVGCLQLHEVFVDEVNRIIGNPYYHELNRRDRAMSVAMAKVWLVYYKGRYEDWINEEPDYCDMAMIFNRGYFGYKDHGRDESDHYWQKVKAELIKLGVDLPIL